MGAMTLKSFLLSCLATASVAATAASAAVYVDVTAAKLEISGTPNIGDLGKKLDDDLPSSAVTFAIGYEITSRIALEARFTDLGDTHVSKLAGSAALFPGQVGATVLTYYYFDQSSELYTLALPIKLVDRGALSLSVAPLLHVERAKFVFTNSGVNTLLLPGPLPVIYRDTRTEFHLGGEVKLAYRFSDHVGVHASYSFNDLEAYDAHLIGAGLDFRF
jgi:hypothetical protein